METQLPQPDDTTTQINTLKEQYNQIIDSMYLQIAEEILAVDKFILPKHGIPRPDKENPVNLFKRQLKIEELSFELAYEKHKKAVEDLVKIGMAD